MRRQVFPFTPHTWTSTLSRTRFVVVRVTSGAGTIPQALMDQTEAGLEERVTWAHVDRNLRHPPSFWTEAFRSPKGPLKRDGSPPEEGFYLFVDRAARAHHGGGSLRYEAAVAPIAHYLRQRMAFATTDTGWTDDEQPSSSQDPGTSEDPWQAPPPRTPPRNPVPQEPDPYEVLGVEPACSDEELRAAYKQALKLNHPDRVAHLSPALQAFALAQTQAIRQAWDILEKKRGL